MIQAYLPQALSPEETAAIVLRIREERQRQGAAAEAAVSAAPAAEPVAE